MRDGANQSRRFVYANSQGEGLREAQDVRNSHLALLDQLRVTCARTLECLEKSRALLRDLAARLHSGD
jgi:hypothetical protein